MFRLISRHIYIYVVLVTQVAWAQMAPSVNMIKPPATKVSVLPMPIGVTTTLAQQPLVMQSGYCPPGYLPQYCGLTGSIGTPCTATTPVYQCIQQARIIGAYQANGCALGDQTCMLQQQMTGCPPGLLGGNCRQIFWQNQMAYQQQQSAAPVGAAAAMAMMPMLTRAFGGGNGPMGAGGGNGAYGYDREIAGGGEGYAPQGSGISSKSPWISVDDMSDKYPILVKLKKLLPVCFSKLGLENCKFQNLGTIGDSNHDYSCHNNGNAMDIGAFNCSNGGIITPRVSQSPASSNSQMYSQIAHCMAGETGNQLAVIYDNESGTNMEKSHKDHSNHMHLETKGCVPVDHQGRPRGG